MAYSVSSAFELFRKYSVDLDTTETAKARVSRSFLIDQLTKLDGTVTGFPKVTGSMSFGSFARRTKIRLLNDIDFLLILSGSGTTETQPNNGDGYRRWLRMDDKTKPLAGFLDEFGFVNSTRILNKIRSSLPNVSYYSKAEIKKTQQAVTVNLSSYDWTFDVVPAIPINDTWGTAIGHYLIPDGAGEWIQTDPRKDSKSMTDANTRNGGHLLPVMRLLKYWNKRTHNKSRLPSYYFETLALRTFSEAHSLNSLQTGIKYFFDYGPLFLNMACADPKGLGPNLDANINVDTKFKIDAAMREAANYANYAIKSENQGNTKDALIFWRCIFGGNFPEYG